MKPPLKSRPRGYGLTEVAMAVMILMVALTLTVKALHLVGVQRRAADRRIWAAQTLSNAMERITDVPFEDVTESRAHEVTGAMHAERTLPQAKWEIAVVGEQSGPIRTKRVSLNLRWRDRSGATDGPARLSAWVFDGGRRS
jgi:hypothetical protein